MHTPSGRREFAIFWTKVAVFDENIPADIEGFSNKELIDWMFATLMRCSARIASEWNLRIDGRILEMIKSAKDSEAKGAMEKTLLLRFYKSVGIYSAKQEKKVREWSSWPRAMLQSAHFNCVGGSLLGLWAFQGAGMRVCAGIPPGHVLTPVNFSDGEWYCLDLGRDAFCWAENIFVQIAGFACLDLRRNPLRRYNFIPLADPSAIIALILSNLNLIKRIGQGDEETRSFFREEDNRDALEKYQEYQKYFPSFDLWEFRNELFPEIRQLQCSKEYKKEEARIKEAKRLMAPK